MSGRTFGATKNCAGCRYWSEMLAYCSGGPVMAMCLVPLESSQMKRQYTAGHEHCAQWESGHDGAIDEPGSDPERYDEEGDDDEN